jgi:hypothetical protein
LIDEGFAWLFQAIVSQWSTLSPRVDADVAAEEQKMREAFAERKRQVELKKAQRLKDEEAKLAAEALQATISEGCALNVPEVCALNARISSYPCRHCHCLILLSYRFP